MLHPLFDLSGRVAVVSGAAQNMGRNSAVALAEIGADLVITDLNTTGLEETADTIRKLGRRVIPVTCDVYNEDQLKAMFELVDKEFGRLDVLANIPGGGFLAHPEDMSTETFALIVHRTLTSKFICCREGGRRMLAQGKGSIINMSSIGGVFSLGRGNFAYSIAQAGVIQMTRELSTEWGDRGIRVNAITPAQITNPGFDVRMDATSGLRETFLRGIPISRLGVPSDIKGLIMFLGSDASGYVSGAVFPLDGGNLAMGANGTVGRREA